MTRRMKKETERREGDCKERKRRKNNRKHDMQEVTGEKMTVEKEGEQWDKRGGKYM